MADPSSLKRSAAVSIARNSASPRMDFAEGAAIVTIVDNHEPSHKRIKLSKIPGQRARLSQYLDEDFVSLFPTRAMYENATDLEQGYRDI